MLHARYTRIYKTTLYALFVKPSSPAHRQYEALRAHFVDGRPVAEVTQQFGQKKGTVYNMVAALRKSATIDHFRSPRSGPKPKPKTPTTQQRDARILELRTRQHLSNAQIHARLKKEKLRAGINTIGLVIREAGLPRMNRRYFGHEQRLIHAPPADHRQYNTADHQFHTKFGGLFLFVKDLITTDLEAMAAHMPGSEQLPAACAIRSLLALKLGGGWRHLDITAATNNNKMGLKVFLGVDGRIVPADPRPRWLPMSSSFFFSSW